MNNSTYNDITDDELAEWVIMWDTLPKTVVASHIDTGRLITALQASREEVERLREQYEEVCLTITEG